LEPAQGSVSAGEERDGYYPGHVSGLAWLGLAAPSWNTCGELKKKTSPTGIN